MFILNQENMWTQTFNSLYTTNFPLVLLLAEQKHYINKVVKLILIGSTNPVRTLASLMPILTLHTLFI